MISAVSELILLCARQVWSKASDSDGEEDVLRYAEVYVKSEKAIEVRKHLDVCEIPEWPRPIEVFPLNILLQLSTYFDE